MVGGVLGAAATLRLWNEFGLQGIPWYTEYLRDFGLWLLLLPVAWIALYAVSALLHPRRQFWHDALCGTAVVDAPPVARPG